MIYSITKTVLGLEFWVGSDVDSLALSQRLRYPVKGIGAEQDLLGPVYSAVERWHNEVYTYEMEPAPYWKQAEIKKLAEKTQVGKD